MGCYIWNTAWYGVETRKRWTVNQKYLEMWCWRRVEAITWTDRERNEVVSNRVKNRNIVHAIKRRKADCIDHIWRRN